MRSKVLTALAGMVLAFVVLPAQAAWHGYVSKEAGFSFIGPGEMQAEATTYTSSMAGERKATLFKTVEDNVEFRVLVVDFAGRNSDEAALIKEAATQFLTNMKVLADADARVDSSYGRKVTFDLPDNGGRAMSGIYFKDGRLIELRATILPANGDYQSPDLGRFVDSLAFYENRAEENATELKLAN